MPDTDPVNTLLAALRADPKVVWHSSSVSVELRGDAVTLTGEVDHIAAKRRAVALAQQLLGKRYRVADRLRRQPTHRLGDREHAQTVGARLSEEPAFADYSLDAEAGGKRYVVHDAGMGSHVIRISVHDDEVLLEGTVGSPVHLRLAEVIAWWTGACAVLVNRLEVVPPREDSDNELNDAVRMTLEKDPLVDASQLHVGTAAGIVHIEGLTLNEEQRDSVVEDAWLVPGVSDVVDRIQTEQV